jgi:hypothetical protein
MFKLDESEYVGLRSQFVTLKPGRGTHRKCLPNVFNEQDVAMLSCLPHGVRNPLFYSSNMILLDIGSGQE